ncbi:MAG TPA: hypothetical protein VJS18_07640 [Paraburkholderia sp.]|nr:hypothetical protein [Paraburkholderia sp.]
MRRIEGVEYQVVHIAVLLLVANARDFFTVARRGDRGFCLEPLTGVAVRARRDAEEIAIVARAYFEPAQNATCVTQRRIVSYRSCCAHERTRLQYLLRLAWRNDYLVHIESLNNRGLTDRPRALGHGTHARNGLSKRVEYGRPAPSPP